jgi:hypothetical protein
MSSQSLKLRPTTYCPPGGRRSSVQMQRTSVPTPTLTQRVGRLARTRWFTLRTMLEPADERIPRSA